MTVHWAAPGRVNLIGEHVDYQDGLVLPFALPFRTTVNLDVLADDEVVVTSRGEEQRFAISTAPGDVDGWAAYVAGVVWALGERGHRVPGLRIDVTSDVPIGAGLSSSAALECAVAGAISDVLDLELSRVELAAVARAAENDYVGVPTGVMDQLASMLCESGHALLLDCRDISTRQVPLDLASSGLTLLVIDTRAEHVLVGSAYGDRRRDCEVAATELGLPSLREATVDDLARLTDPVRRRRAEHVVSEIDRVRAVAETLDAGRPGDIGAFLTASHLSLRDDFEVSCDELDVTVDAALSAGALGARMTGGGFGGCAIALLRDADVAAVTAAVVAAYDRRGWQRPAIFVAEAGPGAHRVGAAD